ncbi:hypothetical protein LL037_11970 [Clostridium estertheticum]|uniref:hypothetical protein n=1 Tax=Clostridium estertheticum TaxID=238834 RepID=UPI001C0DB8E6|nr:hypothetical protein [Clostridium estertheticum]MBU3201949.1 hypothetical protein [Clostridium estertheticum]WAG67809.1 hypothetical protein LL037_11970 [Clostridium estertheticum]
MPTLNNTIEILNSKSTKVLFGDLYGYKIGGFNVCITSDVICAAGISSSEYITYMSKYNNNGIYKVNIRKYGAVNINSLLA